MAVTIDQIQVKFGAEIEELKKKLNQVESQLQKSKKQADQLGDRMEKVGKMIASYFTVGALISFGREIVNTTAKFQTLQAQLETTLGSRSAAVGVMAQIQDFASKTPFQVDQLTDAFVRFANRGVQPSMEQMKQIGDLAAAIGKDFDLLSGAIIDATDPVRWRNLGIVVKREGDMMTGTFKGVNVTVAATTAGALEMAAAFGQLQGVAGGMDRISETLGGKISNLKDNMDALFNTIGDANKGVLNSFLDRVNEIIQSLTEAVRTTRQWADVLGNQRVTNILDNIKIDPNNIKSVEEQNNALQKLNDIINQQERIFEIAAKAKYEYSQRIIKSRQTTQQFERDILGLSVALERLRDIQKEIESLTFGGGARELGAIETVLNQIAERERERPTANKERLAVLNRELVLLKHQLSELERLGLQRKTNDIELIKRAKELQKIQSGAQLGAMPDFVPKLMQEQMQAGLLDPMNQALVLTDMLEGGFQTLFSTLASGGNVLKAFGNYVKQLVARMAAMAATAAILTALTGGSGALALGLRGLFTGGNNAASFGGIFSNLMGFANGGIVYGPTPALVGEYPGARSNPEVIAPLNKLQGMIAGMGMNGNVRFEIEGDKLIGVLQRTERRQFRTS